MPKPARISLLHATFAAGDAAVVARDRWFELAVQPDLLEHIFAFNADDPLSALHPEISQGVSGPPQPGMVTAVRNWNSAAEVATGELLMVVADDLAPTQHGWDELLRALICDLDPLRVQLAMKVRDTRNPKIHLMLHPVVSRAFYARYGLFDSAYEGIGADNDFTLSAHAKGLVLDARSIVLEHRHPTANAKPTASHTVMSSPESLLPGKARFNERWPIWKRRLSMRYLQPSPGVLTISPARLIARRFICRLGWLRGLVPAFVRRAVRRVSRRT
jgi:hypothetical protein